ncbi:addiction module protein [Salinisphaera sp.]|uniref:addiction module protein n=1 Tax=Salinisphaera sp. TaxID=1914330 RepID=UPI0025EA4222|nr:addiction module protein [Salinisphaera sp.]
MSMSIDIEEIIRLPVSERLRVIERLWDSVVLEPEKVDVPDWHRKELRRRLNAYESKPKEGNAWQDVRQRLEGNEKSNR